MNLYIVLICFVPALGGILFGFDTAVIAGTLGYLNNTFHLSAFEQGWLVSSVLLGCIPGSLISGFLADRYGRKPILIISALFYLISAIGCGLVSTFSGLVLYRIIGGVAIGFASTTAPIYISEVAPPVFRGRLGMLVQIAITLGILLSYASNYLIDTSPFINELVAGNKNDLWRYMFGAAAIPSFLFMILAFVIPESPRWLVKVDNEKLALSVFERITSRTSEARLLLEQVKTSLTSSAGTVLSELKKASSVRIIIIGFVFAFLCLFTGINTILYYAPIIFEKTRVQMHPLVQTMFTGGVLFIFTLISLFLIDRLGRKKLLLLGSWLMAICMSGLCVSFYMNELDNYGVLILVLSFIASFALTWGAVVWVLLGELFPNSIRGTATSIANFGNWQANFIITMLFPWMLQSLGGAATFAFFAIMNFASLFFVRYFLIETKGVELEKIEQLYSTSKVN